MSIVHSQLAAYLVAVVCLTFACRPLSYRTFSCDDVSFTIECTAIEGVVHVDSWKPSGASSTLFAF